MNGTGGGDGHWGDLIERLARSRTVVTLDYSGAGETTDEPWPDREPSPANRHRSSRGKLMSRSRRESAGAMAKLATAEMADQAATILRKIS